jgi:hypothetical protein
MKALKPTMQCALPSGEARRCRERQEGTGPERGTDRDEGNSLKGEAQGCSGALDASAGPVVEVAQGVVKPRTRHASAEGSVGGKRICRSETVS